MSWMRPAEVRMALVVLVFDNLNSINVTMSVTLQQLEQITTWLRDQLGTRQAVVGISGGIDSVVVCALLVQAVGAENVHGILMPSVTTSPQDTTDAQKFGSDMEIQLDTIPIEPILEQFTTASSDFLQPLAAANVQARIRMTLLYGKANTVNGMVVGTGNKTELQVGYFTKYGDGGVDILPIGNLYKTEVWQLAKLLHIPEHFITKAPTAGLFPGQTDEADLGMSYQELDAILQAIERKESLVEFSEEHVKLVQQRQSAAQHKLSLPSICTLT